MSVAVPPVDSAVALADSSAGRPVAADSAVVAAAADLPVALVVLVLVVPVAGSVASPVRATWPSGAER